MRKSLPLTGQPAGVKYVRSPWGKRDTKALADAARAIAESKQPTAVNDPGPYGPVPISIHDIAGYPGWVGFLTHTGELVAQRTPPAGLGRTEYLSWGNVKDQLGF
jgi:hypothetical protein